LRRGITSYRAKCLPVREGAFLARTVGSFDTERTVEACAPCTAFTGPDNIIHFFMDDFLSLNNYPKLPEAGTGHINRISVSAVPLRPSWATTLLGLVGVCFFAYRRRKVHAGGYITS
jgi:hypothetical protein